MAEKHLAGECPPARNGRDLHRFCDQHRHPLLARGRLITPSRRLPKRRLRWFSRCGQFTRIGHIPGEGRPLLRKDGPMSYEATPSASFQPVTPARVLTPTVSWQHTRFFRLCSKSNRMHLSFSGRDVFSRSAAQRRLDHARCRYGFAHQDLHIEVVK